MKIKYIYLTMLVPLVLFMQCQAADETFRSLEYGFSIDYPKETKTIAYSIGSPVGIDEPVVNIYTSEMDIYVGVMENDPRSLRDISSIMRSSYEDDYNITESDITEMKLNERDALLFDTVLEDEDGDRQKVMDVLVEGDNSIYQISCRAKESNFNRENKTYFWKAIMSFETFPVSDDSAGKLDGFPIISGEQIWSSAALADINGDGKLEIIFGTNKGSLHALNNDGNDIAGFPVDLNDYVRSSPAVADLNNDGNPEIIVGCDDGGLYVFRGDGSMMDGFPVMTSGAIHSSPAIGDLDEDGQDEIIVGSRDGGIYAWKNDGSLICGFPVITKGGEIWSSPAIGDLNGDSIADLVIGAKSGCKSLVECLSQYSGNFYYGEINACLGNGSSMNGFPKYLPQRNDIGYSSPALADINQDGKLEIVIAGTKGIYVKTSGHDQEDIRGFPTKIEGSCQDSFIAVGDLDKDGKPEIVAGSTNGQLYVWRSDGSDMPGFPIQTGGYIRHITLGDIDNDGYQEILGGSSDNRVHAWKLNGSEAAEFPKVTTGDIETAPTLGDLENDGSLELVVGSDDGLLYAWKISEKYGELSWPMIRQNLKHTGLAET